MKRDGNKKKILEQDCTLKNCQKKHIQKVQKIHTVKNITSTYSISLSNKKIVKIYIPCYFFEE